MNPKNSVTKNDVKKQNVIHLDDILNMIKKIDDGLSKAQIAREYGMNETTVWTITSNANGYKEKGKVASVTFSM